MKPLLYAALTLVLLPISVAYAKAPSISHVLPGGVQPGKAVDVVVHGADLAGPTGVWSNLDLSAELTPGVEGNGTQPTNVSYRLTIPADTPPGVAGLRIATGEGISNLKLFLVDDLPSVVDSGNNKTPDAAQTVSVPVAIDGYCDGETSDFYKISVAAGQRVAVEVFARRLGSPLDPVIRLLTLDGQELAYSDDDPSTGSDSRFEHTFETSGDYLLELRDVRYQGGGNFRYRVRIGDFPLLSVPYPLAVQKGQSANVQLAGPATVLANPLAVTVPEQVAGNQLHVASNATGQAAAWATLIASDMTEQLESETNDSPDSSTAVTIPGAIDGRFETAGDQDYYQFDAKKGQRFVFAGQARSLGSPCDLYMRLYNADGGVLAEAEDAGSAEGALNYTFPADGTYRLRVEETNRRGGPDVVYRIVVSPYQPGFDLEAEAEHVNAPQNGVFVVKVKATRRDYNGPITLGVEGAGEGCIVSGNTIPEGKPETTMNVTLGPSLAAGHVGTIKIRGTAKVGDADFTTTASNVGALRGAFSGLPYPPAVFDGELGLGVGPVFPQFFTLASPSPAASLPKAGSTGGFKVSVTRSHGFDDAVSLSIAGLPVGVEAKPVKIEKGQVEATIELTSRQSIPPGNHAVKLVGNATFQNQPQKFEFDQATITGPPVALALAPAGPLPVGGKQSVTLNFTGDVSPVASTAAYQGGVTRGSDGPRAPELPGFEADNRGVSFSGIDKAPGDDRLTAELPTFATGDYAVELWVYNSRDLSQPNAPSISGYFFSRPGTPTPGNASPGDHLGIGGVESSPRDKLFFYDGQSLVAGRTTLPINTWHHVAIVRAGESVKVYLDGDVANPEIQATVPKSFASNEIVLGTRADGYAPFQGRLDEVAFFDAALAPEQVQAHFAAAKGMTPARDVVLKDNPLAYWRLDETDGAVASSIAPAHKRLVKLAWKNLPSGLTAPAEVVLVDAQATTAVELSAADSVAAGKLENVIVAGTTLAGVTPFTAESVPVALEVTKP